MSNELPNGWLGITLGDKCKFTQGVQISSQNMIRESSNGYMRYMYIRDFLSDDRKWFVEDIYPEKVITELDIAMANTGHTSGTVYKGKLGVLSNNAFKISFSPKEINTDYIFNFLKGDFFLRKIQQLFNTAGQPHVGHGNIAKMPMLLPPLPEQQKIAKILTSVDEVIEKTQAQIDKLKDLKTGMMQELLTNGIGHTEFKDSPVGRIPADWEVDKLINLSTNGINNGIFNDPKKVGKGYKLINVVEMYRGFGVDIKTLKLQDCSEKIFNKNKVEYGDVFFTRSSLKLEGIAFCNINLSHDDDITYDGHLMRVRPDTSRVLPKYLAYYCLSDFARKSFMANAKHSTMTTIGQADIAPLSVSIPSLEEQEQIVKHLDSVESNIRMKNSKLEHNKRIKKALMQDLLIGKVRVKVDS